MPAPEDRRDDSGVAGYGKAYSVIAASLQFAAAVIAGFFAGRWIDGELGTAPWLMFVCMCAGFAGGFASFLRSIRKLAGDGRKTDDKT